MEHNNDMSIITLHFITVLLHNTLVSHYHHKKGFDMFHPYVFVEGAVQEVGLPAIPDR